MSGTNYGDQFRANAARDADRERADFLKLIAPAFDELAAIGTSIESNLARAASEGKSHLSLTFRVHTEHSYKRRDWPPCQRLIEELIKSKQYRTLWEAARTLGLVIHVNAKQRIVHEPSTYNPHGGTGSKGGDCFRGFDVELDFRPGPREGLG
jgi:hypothetical protein